MCIEKLKTKTFFQKKKKKNQKRHHVCYLLVLVVAILKCCKKYCKVRLVQFFPRIPTSHIPDPSGIIFIDFFYKTWPTTSNCPPVCNSEIKGYMRVSQNHMPI